MTDHYFGKWLASPPPGEEVVISGVSGRLPESNNIYEFREHLFKKENMVTANDRRFLLEHSHMPQKSAKIFDIDKFDPGYFGIHHRQADVMDPMMRIFLETAVEAVMDAGVNPFELEGSKTGVFVGSSSSDVEMDTLFNITEPQKMGLTGYLRSLIGHRISYFLKLKGPSYNVDTACSSSLNAIEHALKAIRSGRIDSALVGGCNLLLHPGVTLQFYRLGLLSQDGACKVFDQEADGYVKGESVACIFLQKAKDAKRIYAQIIHGKANDDGFKPSGILVPSYQIQEQLLTEIFDESGIHPSDLSFLEAHGTGTQVGDPEEVEAIDNAIAKKREKPLLIGAVKSNIGHTEPVSGLCSLIKVIIALESGRIPPNINLNKIKKGLKGFEQGRLKVVTETTALENEGSVIGINNFGFGGNNCHLLLRAFKKKKINDGLPDDDIPRLVCVSGRSEKAVLTLLDDLNKKQIDGEYVALLHNLFKKNIPHHLHRGYTIISKNGPLKTSRKFFSGQRPPLFVHFGEFKKHFNILGKYLLDFSPFKAIMLRINKLLLPKSINIIDVILQNETGIKNNFLGAIAVQIAIVEILKLLELNPTAVYGDSSGKLVTAYYNGKSTLEETMQIACKINELFETTSRINFEQEFSYLETETTQRYNNYFNKQHDDTIHNETLREILNDSIILNISDKSFYYKDLSFARNNVVTFLDTLGRLYERGYNLQLHKLYPQILFPVSRGTPMVSPMIKWDYRKRWFAYKYENSTSSDSKRRSFQFMYDKDEHKYMKGHVIDGRNLFPATGYLNIVWQTYIPPDTWLLTNASIIFENCKFIKSVTMPKTGVVTLDVSIHLGSGKFEVLEDNALIVTGRIYVPDNADLYTTDLTSSVLDREDPTLILEQDEIYRELNIRGYNYSGLFKGLVKCNVEATKGLVKWENNWVSFMDNMLHMRILQMDTRFLYIPTGIKKMVIEPTKLLNNLEKQDESLIPINIYKEIDMVKCVGIEISGLQASAISRKKSRMEPVLEKNEFVPNETQFDLVRSLRVNIQIILEITLGTTFKAVEILDDSINSDSKLILPLIKEILEDIPLINPDLLISTKTPIKEIPGITTKDFTLTPESNLLLIIGIKILQRSNLTQILSALSPNGFVLTREEIDFVPEEIEDIEILTQHVTPVEKCILFQKSRELSNVTVIKVSSLHFDWIPALKNSLKGKDNTLVYAQNEEFSGILGLVNCIRREPGGNKVRCFFMIDGAPQFDPQNMFYRDQIKKNFAINIYKNKAWGTYRHLVLENTFEVESEHCYINTTAKGDLSSLKWIEGPLTKQTTLPKSLAVFHCYHSSLNFKDVLLATGRISMDDFYQNRIKQELSLGMEFSGRDQSGKRVTGIVIGAGLSSLVVAEKFIWDVPEPWSLEEAATVPVVYSTVLYALLSVTTLKPGTSVLIHSATGGIGIAALNVCLYHGCEIFVTVGTQEKRDFLRQHFPQILDNHIGCSRDTSFEEMINIQTNGYGVDIVLNSLVDDKLKASIRCLTKGGRLLEIGKYDLARDSSLNLLLMEKEVSYHGIMLDRICEQSSEKTDWLVNKLYEGIKLGYVKPLPRTVFKMNEVEEAFRFMTTGKHIGKVVIKIRDEEDLRIVETSKMLFPATPRFNCDSEKSYIIVGGLGGFGMELAYWLMLRGAKKLILVSSQGVRTGYQTQRINIWKSYGVAVYISKNDITTKQGCYNLIEEANKFGPVDGIFNLAVVLKDALFQDQTEESFRIALAPKASATLYLDKVTREICQNLRLFVVFSSLSCGRGNPGQSNYGMANSIMERICEKRKRDGFPALAIQWGAIGEVGLVAKMQKENKELVIGGTLQQRVSNCLEVLDQFLTQNHPIVGSMVVAEKRSKDYVRGSVVEAVAYILGIKDLKLINRDALLTDLGMDSITGTEIIQLLEKDFDIYLTSNDIRSLNFAKLIKLESEKHNSSERKNGDKTESSRMDLRYLPETSNLHIIKLPSGVCDCDEAATVFVFPGIEGVITPLESLINNLSAHVYGVHYSYNKPEDTIKEMSETILPHIEENLIEGQTVHLICYSFGAIVGLEVVFLLETKGYKCNIIAIDGAPAYFRSAIVDNFNMESEAIFQTILSLKLLAFFLPREKLEENEEKLLKCSSYEERIDLVTSLAPPNTTVKKLEKQGAIALYKRFKAVVDYNFVHEKIKSPASLIRAKFPIVSVARHDYELSELFEQSVEVAVIEGDHATLLNQPKLIETVNRLLCLSK